MDETIKLLKEEEKEADERLKSFTLADHRATNKEKSLIDGVLAKFESIADYLKGYKPPQVEFPTQMEVTGKVTILDEIKAIVKFPTIQKIIGAVKVENFPNIFKVEGRVKADVDFPTVQEIKGSVDVTFPKKQSVEMDLSKLIEAIQDGKLTLAEGVEPDAKKANPTRYLPVRLTNGKMFYEIFEHIGDSNGKVASLLEQILVKPTTGGSATVSGIIDAKAIDLYSTNNIDENSATANVTYVGKQRDDGAYCVIKLDETTGATPIMQYATNRVNPVITSYSGAWNNKTTLAYVAYDQAF